VRDAIAPEQIIPLIAAAALLLVSLALLVDFLIARSRRGTLLHALPRRPAWHFVGILIAAPTLILIAFARPLVPIAACTVCAAAELCWFVAFRDVLFIALSGVYDRALIWQDSFLPYRSVARAERIDLCTLILRLRGGRRRIVRLEQASSADRLVEALNWAGVEVRDARPSGNI